MPILANCGHATNGAYRYRTAQFGQPSRCPNCFRAWVRLLLRKKPFEQHTEKVQAWLRLAVPDIVSKVPCHACGKDTIDYDRLEEGGKYGEGQPLYGPALCTACWEIKVTSPEAHRKKYERRERARALLPRRS